MSTIEINKIHIFSVHQHVLGANVTVQNSAIVNALQCIDETLTARNAASDANSQIVFRSMTHRSDSETVIALGYAPCLSVSRMKSETTKREDKQQRPSLHVLEEAVDRKDTFDVLRAG